MAKIQLGKAKHSPLDSLKVQNHKLFLQMQNARLLHLKTFLHAIQ